MPALITSATSSTSRHLQHKISERLDQCRQIQLAFDIRARDRAHDPTHPRFMATYLSHCGDADWLTTILTDITVPNRLMEIATHRRLLAPLQPTSSLETRRICNDHQPTPAMLPLPPPITCRCRHCQAPVTAEPPSTPSYPIVDPYGDHALGCRRSLPHRTTSWHDPTPRRLRFHRPHGRPAHPHRSDRHDPRQPQKTRRRLHHRRWNRNRHRCRYLLPRPHACPHHFQFSNQRPPTPQNLRPPAPCRDHSPWSCPRNPRRPSYPLRPFQPDLPHSPQRASPSPPTGPVPPTAT